MNDLLLESANELFKESENNISLLSNASAFIKAYVPDLNWAGFYLFENSHLILGPFQGLPACVKIAVGSGVCGTAFEQGTILNVTDVHQFDGHIACDSNSNSELVVPLIKDGHKIGVFDIDSPLFKRFDESTEHFLVEVSKLVLKYYCI
ncbi:MAG TPA: GAF domain-containing protein [Acholeplasma sp.]|nr:GAF domain-containing protein [Acholeplasma sp.]